MAHQKGSTVDFLLGFENSAYGTAATTAFTVPVNSSEVRNNRNKNSAATLSGSRNPTVPFSGNVIVSGPIVVPIDSLVLPYWCVAMFGDPSSSGEGPYVHEFKIADTMPSFTWQPSFTDLATDKYEEFVGCKVAGFSMTVGGEGELAATLEIAGANSTLEAAAMDGAPSALTLARLDNFEAAILEGGGSLSNATELSLNIDFGLDTSNYVIGGEGILGSMPEGNVSVAGNLKTLFEDTTLLDKAIADTESSLKLTITNSASSIFEIEIQELEYSVNSPAVPGPEGLLVDLDFQGFYTNGSEASAVVMRVTNGVASYDLIS